MLCATICEHVLVPGPLRSGQASLDRRNHIRLASRWDPHRDVYRMGTLPRGPVKRCSAWADYGWQVILTRP